MRKLVLLLIVLFAVGALAQGNGMQPVVAPDGTVLVTRPVVSQSPMQNPMQSPMSWQVVAVSPNGVTLWTFDAAAMMQTLAIRDGRVFLAGGDEIVALSLATGAVQWRRDVTGTPMGVETAANRVYVVTRAGMVTRNMMGRGSMHGGSSDATLYALDAATGTVLWTLELK